MSCFINLFAKIPAGSGLTITGGGTWSMSPSPENGPANNVSGIRTIFTTGSSLTGPQQEALVASVPASFGATAAITSTTTVTTALANVASSQYLWIDPASIPAGVYKFRYTVSAGATCSDSADITVTILDGVEAGSAVTMNLCSDDANVYPLFNFLPTAASGNIVPPSHGPCPGETTTTPCGTWTTTVTSAGYNATNKTFQPSLVVFPVGSNEITFTFTYTVAYPSAVGTDGGCTGGYCSDSATLTLKVIKTGYAGGDGAITLCNKL
jgi:hypothetical protein